MVVGKVKINICQIKIARLSPRGQAMIVPSGSWTTQSIREQCRQSKTDPRQQLIARSESEYCLTGAAGKPRCLGVNHSCRSSMVSHRCSLNPVTFSTGLGTLGACG